MTDWLIALLIGVGVGLLLGIKIAHDSNARQPVLGGIPAQLFHYLACAGLSGMLPFIIAGIVVGLSFLALFGTAIGFLVLTGIFLLAYAGFESGTGSHSAAH